MVILEWGVGIYVSIDNEVDKWIRVTGEGIYDNYIIMIFPGVDVALCC
jgi:hypothetical protein